MVSAENAMGAMAKRWSWQKDALENVMAPIAKKDNTTLSGVLSGLHGACHNAASS